MYYSTFLNIISISYKEHKNTIGTSHLFTSSAAKNLKSISKHKIYLLTIYSNFHHLVLRKSFYKLSACKKVLQADNSYS